MPAVCVKAAPGLPADLIPDGWEAEFIADGRDLKEAVLWSPALATAPVAASAARAARWCCPARSRTRSSPAPVTRCRSPSRGSTCSTRTRPSPGPAWSRTSPGRSQPTTAPTAARRRRRRGDVAKIDPQIAFLTLNRPVQTPFARTLRVLDSAPWNEKRFARRLRELGIGAADIRRRGLAGDVDQIHRRLKLAGPNRATIVITRVNDKPWGLICGPVN